jgi:hypothetical protein
MENIICGGLSHKNEAPLNMIADHHEAKDMFERPITNRGSCFVP